MHQFLYATDVFLQFNQLLCILEFRYDSSERVEQRGDGERRLPTVIILDTAHRVVLYQLYKSIGNHLTAAVTSH